MNLQHVTRVLISLLSLTIGFAFANDNRLASNEPNAPELPMDYQEQEYVPESDYENEEPYALDAKPQSVNPAWQKLQEQPIEVPKVETTVKDQLEKQTLPEDLQKMLATGAPAENIQRVDLKSNNQRKNAIERLQVFLTNDQGDYAAALYAKTLRTNGRACKEEALFMIAQFSGKPVINTMIRYLEKMNEAEALNDVSQIIVIQNCDNVQASKAEQAGKRVEQKEAQKRIKRGPLAWLASLFK